MDITELFKNFTLLGATWVLWLLVILSILSIGIMIERWLYYGARTADLETLSRDVQTALEDRETATFTKKYGDTPAMPARVAMRGVATRHKGIDAVSEAMNSEKALARQGLEKNLVVLGTLGNNAPFIGLFGTVLGIIQAFADLSKNSDGGADVVMDGISEALVATAVGLLVAIPAVIAFNYFNRRVRLFVTSTDAIAHTVLSELYAQRDQDQDQDQEDED